MPKKPKPAHEMTSDELARRVFPKKVHEHLKRVANPDSETDEQPLPVKDK